MGSFEVDNTEKGNQVFFFFREIAEEYTASKTKIFSRVAKVCKVRNNFCNFLMLTLKNAEVLGHLKTINFPFVPNGKLVIFGYPNI